MYVPTYVAFSGTLFYSEIFKASIIYLFSRDCKHWVTFEGPQRRRQGGYVTKYTFNRARKDSSILYRSIQKSVEEELRYSVRFNVAIFLTQLMKIAAFYRQLSRITSRNVWNATHILWYRTALSLTRASRDRKASSFYMSRHFSWKQNKKNKIPRLPSFQKTVVSQNNRLEPLPSMYILSLARSSEAKNSPERVQNTIS